MDQKFVNEIFVTQYFFAGHSLEDIFRMYREQWPPEACEKGLTLDCLGDPVGSWELKFCTAHLLYYTSLYNGPEVCK